MAQTHPNRLPFILWSLACIAVVGAIAGGLMVTGGPQVERMRRMDTERSRDLEQLRTAITEYYQTHRKLPDTLATLKNTQEFLTDPETQKPYQYKQAPPSAFTLCATFNRDSQTENRRSYPQSYRYYEPSAMQFTDHPKGFYCFQLQKTAQSTTPDGRSEFAIQ